MHQTRTPKPGGITHGMVVWFLIGSLFGGILFINVFFNETPLPRIIPQTTGMPTRNQAAYDAYLNGIDHGRDGDHDRAAEQYARAVEEDPEFSVAWAALSRAHSAMYADGTDPTEDRLAMARDAVDRAFQIDPDLPEAHLALAYYYYRGPRDYERSLEELAIAEPHFPDDVDLLRTRAFMYRSAGEWSAALYELSRAAELEPDNTELLEQQAITHLARRDYVLAASLLDRALEREPNDESLAIERAMIPLYRNGDASALRAVAEGALGSGRPWMAWLAAFTTRDFTAAREALDGTARDTLAWQDGYLPKALAYGLTEHWAGNAEVAELHFDDAREVLEQDLQTDPDNPDLLVALGEALAYLGAHESAVRMARRVIDVLPESQDAFTGPRFRLSAARVLAAAGDRDAALQELETYLLSAGRFSIRGIAADPRFDPLRAEARFQALMD